MTAALSKDKPGDHRLALHYTAFVAIYVMYGYQVCPFLDDLSLGEISAPAIVAVALHWLAQGVAKRFEARTAITSRVERLFMWDWGLFVLLGTAVAIFNSIAFGYPIGSGGKVLVGFAVLGLYISLDMALRRDLGIACQLRAQGMDFPLADQFLPYQTKFMLFSALNVVVMAVIGVLVALKDLVWVRSSGLDVSSIQLLVLLDTAVVVGILGSYIMIVVKQYSRKIAFSLSEETSALTAVESGDLSSRVAITSNDEFGRLAYLTNTMIARLGQSITEVERNKSAIIQALVALAAKRDSETGHHLIRTQMYVRMLAEHLSQTTSRGSDLSPDALDRIVKAAPLHDIGKVGVPDAILQKPGRLDAAEFDVMKTHTSIGADALRQANHTLGGSAFLATAIEIAEHHHERWDGLGYPAGLAGENIPLSARIMAVADVYDAVRSPRVYKTGRSHEEAAAVIGDGAGNHFDPAVAAAFVAVQTEIERIAADLGDDGKDLEPYAQRVAA
ncbi:MAG: HD domain-containing phosphohydrolase [Pseudomonadota bacterium]